MVVSARGHGGPQWYTGLRDKNSLRLYFPLVAAQKLAERFPGSRSLTRFVQVCSSSPAFCTTIVFFNVDERNNAREWMQRY